MAQIRLGPNGLPVNEGFFGNQGLGGALASLPGTGAGEPDWSTWQPGQTPPGGYPARPPQQAPPSGNNTGQQAPPGYGAGDPGYDPTQDPNVPGGGINGTRDQSFPYPGYEQPGAQGPLAGGTPAPSGRNTGEPGGSRTSTPQVNPGLPPPPSTAGTGGFFGEQNPWAQNVGASINDQPVSFASPGNPNPNYITPEAAGKIGQAFGANVVEQNRTNMSSPGSSAPSAPIYGLDYGVGDIQGADVAATGLARGDRPEDIAARYAAGLKNTGWGGPAPTVSRADENGMWNYSSPISTYDPSQSNAQQAQLIQWLRGQLGQG